MNAWQLQEAKARFSEMVKEALEHGPQEITLRGKPAAVLISKQEYERLLRPKLPFVKFIQESPLHGLDIPFDHDPSMTRDTEDL